MNRWLGASMFAGLASVGLGAACGGSVEESGCAVATATEPCTPGKCLRVWCNRNGELGEIECFESVEMDIQSWARLIQTMGLAGLRAGNESFRWRVYFTPWEEVFETDLEVCPESTEFEDVEHDGFITWLAAF
jgi:hypothetical protein